MTTDDPRLGRLSASGVEVLALCPGSENAQRGLPELPPEEIRDSGVQIHAALAGDIVALEGLATDDMAVYESMSERAYALAEANGFDPNKFIAEERLWFPSKEEPEFSGQADRIYLNGPRTLCLDFKSGFLDVTTAAFNAQLATLAILVIHRYSVVEVMVAIIPRYGKVTEIATYTPFTAEAALQRIRTIILAAKSLNAPRVAGDKQCRYCRARLTCVEHREWALSGVMEVAHRAAELPALPADVLANALDRCGAATRLIEQLKTEGKRRLAAGDEEFAKFYELSKGRKTTTVTDLFKLFSHLKAIGVTEQEFGAQCDIPIGTVDADKQTGILGLVHSKTLLKGKRLRAQADELMAGCVTEGLTSGSLKRKEETT